jgi:hypothetical protein
MDFLVIALFVLVLGVLAVAANEFGVDSRDQFDDPRRSVYPVGLG